MDGPLRQSLTLNQIQSLRQEQILAPQQIQSLEILLATLPELEQKITEELAENPTLELLEPGREDLAGNPVEMEGPALDADQAAQAAEKDEALATLIQLGEMWQDYAPWRSSGRGPATEEDEKRLQHLFDSLTKETGLQEFLLEQLRETEGLSEKERRIAEEIIGSIDEAGYLRTHLADIAIACNAELGEVQRVLRVVQTFDPPGVGARDLRECLLLQLKRAGRTKEPVYELVDKYLEDIGRNRIPEVARKMNVTPTRIYEFLEDIRKLSPFPGSAFSPEQTRFVVPEVFVEKDEKGEWQVRTNREAVPRLRISPQYLALLKNPETPADVKNYIRDKLMNSRSLLRALENRESTIVRITRILLDVQRDFFEKGPEHLKPLTMSQVADELGVHETTVSRAVAGKYLQTPHGIFPFRKFFASGVSREDGSQVSSVAVKQKLQELVQNEDKRKPYSDQKLAQLLKDQGFPIARRTVAKYREELGIAPSHMRRTY